MTFTFRVLASGEPVRRAADGNFLHRTGVAEMQNPNHGGKKMDWDRIEGNWKQAKGKVREKWGQLTSDDIEQINGRRDQLEGKIQERYGLAKDAVRKDVDDWLKTVN